MTDCWVLCCQVRIRWCLQASSTPSGTGGMWRAQSCGAGTRRGACATAGTGSPAAPRATSPPWTSRLCPRGHPSSLPCRMALMTPLFTAAELLSCRVSPGPACQLAPSALVRGKDPEDLPGMQLISGSMGGIALSGLSSLHPALALWRTDTICCTLPSGF